METPRAASAAELASLRRLMASWQIALEAEFKSPDTVTAYVMSARMWLDWCAETGRAPEAHLPGAYREFLAHLRAVGRADSTVRVRYTGLRSFSRWLHAEEVTGADGMAAVTGPTVVEGIPPVVSVDERNKILAACKGKGFLEVRDKAMISLLFESMLRSSELLGLAVDPRDVDAKARLIHVRGGKGRRERYTTCGPTTALALDKYERLRETHKHAGLDAYFIGRRGAVQYQGLYYIVQRRCEMAGVEAHPHMLRGGGAVDFSREGGELDDLMTLAGWSTVKMANHYRAIAMREISLARARKIFDKK